MRSALYANLLDGILTWMNCPLRNTWGRMPVSNFNTALGSAIGSVQQKVLKLTWLLLDRQNAFSVWELFKKHSITGTCPYQEYDKFIHLTMAICWE